MLSLLSAGLLVLLLFQEDPEQVGTSWEVRAHAKAVWAFVGGRASAHNDFSAYHRGEDLDLNNDFGLDQGAAFWDLELSVRFAQVHKITLHSLYGSLSGETVFHRSFEYNDNVFQAGESARTEFDVDMRDLEYSYRFLQTDEWTLWAGAGGRWAWMNVGLSSTTLDSAGSLEDNKAIYPTANVGFEVRFAPALSLDVSMRGSPLAVPILFSHASLGRFIETQATLEWKVMENFRVQVGGTFSWWWQRWKGHESDGHWAVNYVDIRLFGPSVGLEISF